MATVEITKWEIAKMFGMEYLGELENKDSYGYTTYSYQYEFHGKIICIDSYMDESDAHEDAAEIILKALAKAVVTAGLFNE